MNNVMACSMAAALVAGVAGAQEKTVPAWVESLSLKGDFRYRHEIVDAEGKDTRHRERVRLRLNVSGKVNDDIGVIVGLASGSEDPVSSNQTLDGAGTSKAIWLDMAYMKWAVQDGLTVLAGKMSNPLVDVGGSGLLWDGDWRPEGLAASYKLDLEGFSPFVHAVGIWMDERSSDSDSLLYGGQAGVVMPLGETAKLTVGGGYYTFTELKGFALLVDDEDSFGNTTDTNADGDLVYATDFSEVEGFVALTLDMGLPLTFFGNYVVNTDASDEDTAFALGASIGKVKAPGSWSLGYQYRDIEKDAVLGAISDSDFGGGGTDARGHVLQLGVGLAGNTSLGVTYFMNETGDADASYDRWQLDASMKF